MKECNPKTRVVESTTALESIRASKPNSLEGRTRLSMRRKPLLQFPEYFRPMLFPTLIVTGFWQDN